jgi:hypothetical protein
VALQALRQQRKQEDLFAFIKTSAARVARGDG